MSEPRYAPFAGLAFDRPRAGVLRIRIDTPGRLNAVDRQKHSDLSTVWSEVDRDPETRVALLCGAAGDFSAGGDLEMIEDLQRDFDTRLEVMREARDLVYQIINCSKPIVSAIEGWAVGAGLAAALLADVSIAGRSAKIMDGHVRLGVAAGDHAAILWPLLCGMARAKYYLLTCERLSGEEAERIGLVSRCVDDGEVESVALDVAERLARGSQSAIRFTKYALNNWLRSAGPAFDASLALEMLGFAGPDAAEGLAAIRERREPRFGGSAHGTSGDQT
ncbi:MAG: enoyl-CoA hydratase/isomerase family protein [Myxococcota bacterium]